MNYLKKATLAPDEIEQSRAERHINLKKELLKHEVLIIEKMEKLNKYKQSYLFPLQQIVSTYGEVVGLQEIIKYLKELEVELFGSENTK